MDMDNKNSDDMLVDKFLSQHATPLPDDGFTQRVMTRLPDSNAQRLNRLWIAFCTLLGVVVFYLCNGWQAVKGTLHGLFADILTNDWSLWHNPLSIYICAMFVLMSIAAHRLAHT